jgi:DMSO reductase anchor subunit
MAGLAAGAIFFTVLGLLGVVFAWPQTNYVDPMATVTFWFGMVFLLLAVFLDVYRREFVPDELIHKKRRPKVVYKRDIR